MIRLPHDKAALVLRAQRLAREQQTLTGSLPSLEWLAQRCGTRHSPVAPAVLEGLLLIWWRKATAELDRPGGCDGEGAGLPLLERIAAPADGADPSVPCCPCSCSASARSNSGCSGTATCASIRSTGAKSRR